MYTSRISPFTFASWKPFDAVASIRALGLDSLGDSFMVEAGERRMLIDAGKSQRAVADRLVREGTRSLDVVVCTHCDDDHIGGVPAVLAAIAVDELWVPGSWLSVLENAGTATEEELEEFLAEQLDVGVLADSGSPVDDWADAVVAEMESQLETFGDRYKSPEMATNQDAWSPESVQVGLRRLSDSDDREMDRRLKQRFAALRKVLESAISSGTRIRYFSYEAAEASPDVYWRHSGEPDLLTIVNAREVFPLASPALALRLAFALTIQNRRAIVPFATARSPFEYGPPTGVLMCSDSSFEFLSLCPLPWSRVGVVTAPHHGSANSAHDPLYVEAASNGFNGWWMRSHNDTTYPDWPGTHWRGLDERRRFCTRCRGDRRRPAQDVWLVSDGTQWIAPDRLRPCRCGDG